MRIVVTGHRGYIGTVLTPLLDAAGHSVGGIDRAAQDLRELGAYAEEAASGIPGARLEFFENCGHLLPLEEPKRVARTIVTLIQETFKRSNV